MLKFRFNVYYSGVQVYQSADFEYSIILENLNDIIERVYDFNDMFGGKVLDTRGFTYTIEEVCEQ